MDSRKKITELRQRIDEIDHNILDLYQRRLEIVRDIAALKIETGLQAEQPARLKTIRSEREKYIKDLDINTLTLHKIITLFHDDAVAIQETIIAGD